MNLRALKNFVLRQETSSYRVTGIHYEAPRRYGIGLGTLAMDNWYVTLENGEDGYRVASNQFFPLSDFNPNELLTGNEVKGKRTKIFGITVYERIERCRE